MVARGPSVVPSRPGGRGDLERLKRFQIAVHNASACACQRRVAAKGAAGSAQPVRLSRGPPVTGGVPAGVSWQPVNGGALAGTGAALSKM